MKFRTICLLAGLALLPNLICAQTQQERLKQHVYTLAADSLRGRWGGTVDAQRAANYIAGQYRAMGLAPLYSDYFVPFKDRSGYRNVVGVIEGSDPVLKHQFIVIGAHYDHLGLRGDSVIFNGADDNASGTAATIEIARALLARKGELKRSVIFACFDGEEQGLLGSKDFSAKLATANDKDNDNSILYCADDLNVFAPIENIKLMMSLDMVGWLKQGKELRVIGTGMLRGSDEIMNGVASRLNFPLSTKALDNFPGGSTDSEPFAKLEVPAFYVTTGLKSPYHKPDDDANRIDYAGLDQIVNYLTEAIVTLSGSDKLEATGRIARKHRAQLPLVEGGVSVGHGRNSLICNDGGFTSHSLLGYHGGLMGRVNIKQFAIQVEALYDQQRTQIPNSKSCFDDNDTLSQGAITIPVTLQLQSKEAFYGAYVGIGAYYSHVLNTRYNKKPIMQEGNPNWEVNPDQWGLDILFGFRLARWLVQFSFQEQMNSQFIENPKVTSPAYPAPHMRSSNFRCTLTYLF